MTATVTKLSDTDPYEWPSALENAFGAWGSLLADPDELETRAAWLRTTDPQDFERDNSLEDLVASLSEFVDDPGRLDARAAALRAFEAAIELADQQFKVDKAKYGIDGATFMAGEDPLPDTTGPCWACGH